MEKMEADAISPTLPAPATMTIVVMTLATYLVQIAAGGNVVAEAIGLVPTYLNGRSIMHVEGGQAVPAWLTLITYLFPHGGWWHVAMNMAGLWFFGRYVEPAMGTRRFALGYFASGIVTGLAIVLLVPYWEKPAAGASGAIAGILGAAVALRLPNSRVRDPRGLGLLGIESVTVLGIAGWLLVRTPPPAPDRLCALMWHLIPFLAGWLWVRLGRRGASPLATVARHRGDRVAQALRR